MAHFNQTLGANLQPRVNEIGIARFIKGPFKSKFPFPRCIPNGPAASAQLVISFAVINVFRIQNAGLDINDVFRKVRAGVMEATHGKQVPWDSSSLTAPYYFVASAPMPAAAAPVTSPMTTTGAATREALMSGNSLNKSICVS